MWLQGSCNIISHSFSLKRKIVAVQKKEEQLEIAILGARHEQILLRFAERQQVVIGTTQHNSSVVNLSEIRHDGSGHTCIGKADLDKVLGEKIEEGDIVLIDSQYKIPNNRLPMFSSCPMPRCRSRGLDSARCAHMRSRVLPSFQNK